MTLKDAKKKVEQIGYLIADALYERKIPHSTVSEWIGKSRNTVMGYLYNKTDMPFYFALFLLYKLGFKLEVSEVDDD